MEWNPGMTQHNWSQRGVSEKELYFFGMVARCCETHQFGCVRDQRKSLATESTDGNRVGELDDGDL